MKNENRLAKLRTERKLTQAEVAKVLDLDVTTVCKHETGDRGLRSEEVAKYAKLYKVQSHELFMEPEEETTKESE